VKAVFFEAGVRASDALLRDVAAALQRCARWHGCPDVRLVRSEPPQFLGRLGELLGSDAVAAAA
jgi:uncharacterized protein YcaQ